MTISEVLKKHTGSWMKISGVIGTGEGNSESKPCVMIMVERKSKTIENKIPKMVDGYKVIFQETGVINAQVRN